MIDKSLNRIIRIERMRILRAKILSLMHTSKFSVANFSITNDLTVQAGEQMSFSVCRQ